MPEVPSVIAGVITGPDGRPIDEARLFLAETPVPVPDVAALSDRDGRFELPAPVPGTYVVAVMVDAPTGLVRETVTVEVGTPGVRRLVDVRLDVGD